MELSFAPLQGLTYCTMRTVHAGLFGGADKYYAPFIAPDSTGSYKVGDMRDILPENNDGIALVPQILANNPEAFISVADELSVMGYKEINLNVGCPSGTVFAKHKGSGMLTDLNSLDSFLDTVFSRCSMKISIKTRMGVSDTEEFGKMLEIYNKYPVYQLAIHARSRNGMYRSVPDKAAFSKALQNTSIPVIYNGNIFHVSDADEIANLSPSVHGLMIGRGACRDPSVFRQIRGGSKADIK